MRLIFPNRYSMGGVSYAFFAFGRCGIVTSRILAFRVRLPSARHGMQRHVQPVHDHGPVGIVLPFFPQQFRLRRRPERRVFQAHAVGQWRMRGDEVTDAGIVVRQAQLGEQLAEGMYGRFHDDAAGVMQRESSDRLSAHKLSRRQREQAVLLRGSSELRFTNAFLPQR